MGQIEVIKTWEHKQQFFLFIEVFYCQHFEEENFRDRIRTLKIARDCYNKIVKIFNGNIISLLEKFGKNNYHLILLIENIIVSKHLISLQDIENYIYEFMEKTNILRNSNF